MKINSKHSKLDCPRFDVYDFFRWYMKVEQFFEVVETLEEKKVQIVMIHLDGKALQWHQRYMKAKGPLKEVKEPTYAMDMRARFNDTTFEDLMSELVSLKQLNQWRSIIRSLRPYSIFYNSWINIPLVYL